MNTHTFVLCFSSLVTHRAYSFRNFKRSCIMLYDKPWEHPSAVATLSIFILLSARINSSTRRAVASAAIPTGRSGRAASATFERPWENISTQLRNKHFPPLTGNISLWISFALSHFAHKNAQENGALRYYTPKARSQFLLPKQASEYAHARLLYRLLWRWTVLLPSDTHRKHIKLITAVLLPFVICLLILPRMWCTWKLRTLKNLKLFSLRYFER
jgi:hypothetical protein